MRERKFLASMVALMILTAAPFLWGRTAGEEAPQSSLSSRGDVTTTGILVSIPGLAGSSRVTYTVIVANDDDADTLLVATDVATADAAGMPAPSGGLNNMTKVIPVLPGEKLNLDQGAQFVGLRAETGTVPARLIITRR